MHRLRFGSIIAAVALAAGLMALAATPAGAVTSGCNSVVSGTVGAGAAAAVPGAQIGMYPATPSGQSFLKLACTFTAAASSAKYTLHDFQNAFYHQGEARTVVTSAVTPNAGLANATCATAPASCVIQLNATTGTNIASFVNHGISGQGVPKRAFIKLVDTVNKKLTMNTPAIPAANVPNTTNPPVPDTTTGPIPIGASLRIDNGTSRSVADATINNTNVLTSAKANFKAGTVAAGGDVGASITSTDIPENCTISVWTSATQVTMSCVGTGPPAGDINQTLSIGAATQTTTARTVNDATYQAGNKVTTVVGKFDGTSQGDIGMPVYGPGIAAGAVITAIVGNQATLSAVVTVSAGAKVVQIGDPSATAPANGDPAINQGAQLDLNPALVAGSNKCALNKPESFGIEGQWRNPGGFEGNTSIGALQFGAQPANTAVIAQIAFKTAVVTYAGYIVQRAAAVAGDPQAAAHYDITFPNIPTALALCAASPAGIGFAWSFNATASTQAQIPSGVGRPSTAQARGTRPLAAGTLDVVATMKSDDGAKPFNMPSKFAVTAQNPTGNCRMYATPVVDFHCGIG